MLGKWKFMCNIWEWICFVYVDVMSRYVILYVILFFFVTRSYFKQIRSYCIKSYCIKKHKIHICISYICTYICTKFTCICILLHIPHHLFYIYGTYAYICYIYVLRMFTYVFYICKYMSNICKYICILYVKICFIYVSHMSKDFIFV